jgi:hypothetical protein
MEARTRIKSKLDRSVDKGTFFRVHILGTELKDRLGVCF